MTPVVGVDELAENDRFRQHDTSVLVPESISFERLRKPTRRRA